VPLTHLLEIIAPAKRCRSTMYGAAWSRLFTAGVRGYAVGMLRLAHWEIQAGDAKRRIELYWGDLSALPPEHAVDILVVSAFHNDYMPTPTSLIGALDRNGVSVRRLSFDKEKDMRADFSCWLSRPVGVRSFGRILCIESGWRGTPPEIADDLFRAIAPISLTSVPTRSVAMPLIGAGDQGYSAADMLEAILKAAVSWLRRGMPVDVLKIVAYSNESALQAKQRFITVRDADSGPATGARWDVFLSYSSEDAAVADEIERSLAAARSHIRIFRDKDALQLGASWLMQIAEAIDSAHSVMAVYTPSYWNSIPCKDELTAAYVRQTKERRQLLFPVYYQEARLPSYFEALHYADCREADLKKLSTACRAICAALPVR
jgi:TIR domain